MEAPEVFDYYAGYLDSLRGDPDLFYRDLKTKIIVSNYQKQ